MRNAIAASQRLSATLYFLVPGQAFEDQKFTTEIAPQTLSRTPLILMCPPWDRITTFTIFTLDSEINTYTSLCAQDISNSLNVSSIIVQTFNTAPTPSIKTTQT
jgi:hypothetical protein